MPDWAIALVAFGGLLSPFVLAAMARDRSLVGMINTAANGAAAKVDSVRKETIALINAQTGPLHDRINRVRDEYVRRDDLQAHLVGIEKRFDDLRAELRRSSESTDKKLDEIQKTLRAGGK